MSDTEEYCVNIRGEFVDDDGLKIDMGPITGAWWEVSLPLCPDCGGDLIWWEAGYVPGTRKCVGKPIEVDGREEDTEPTYNVGCGSLFSVQTRDGRATLRRERCY